MSQAGTKWLMNENLNGKKKFSAKGKLKNVVRIFLQQSLEFVIVYFFCKIRLPLTRGLKTAQSL